MAYYIYIYPSHCMHADMHAHMYTHFHPPILPCPPILCHVAHSHDYFNYDCSESCIQNVFDLRSQRWHEQSAVVTFGNEVRQYTTCMYRIAGKFRG